MAKQGNKDLPDIPQADAYSDVSAPAENLAETSGQNEDMRRTTSDDGTIPPTAAREAITTGVDPARVNTPTGATTTPSYIKANPGLSPDIRIAEPPPAGVNNATAGTSASTGQKNSGAGQDPHNAAAGDSGVTLAPTDPMRDTGEGEPYLDDANPFGRALPNQQDRPMGGTGTWTDPQKRVSHEQPGSDAANPLPQGLNSRPHRDPEA